MLGMCTERRRLVEGGDRDSRKIIPELSTEGEVPCVGWIGRHPLSC